MIYLNLGAVRCGDLGESMLVAITVMVREILIEDNFLEKFRPRNQNDVPDMIRRIQQSRIA